MRQRKVGEVEDLEILLHMIKETTERVLLNCHIIFSSALRRPEELVFRVDRTFVAKELLISFPAETHEFYWVAILRGCLFLLWTFWCSWIALWHSVGVCLNRLADFVLNGLRIGVLDVDFDRVFIRLNLDHSSDLHIVDRAEKRSFPSHLAFAEIKIGDATY